jgi:hypothetical protein
VRPQFLTCEKRVFLSLLRENKTHVHSIRAKRVFAFFDAGCRLWWTR